MKSIYKILFSIFLSISILSCQDYLDVVPDNTLELESIFQKRESAFNALAKVYNYMPQDDKTHQSTWLMGDEYIGRQDADVSQSLGQLRGIRIMRGLQSKNKPMLDSWLGKYDGENGVGGHDSGAKSLYRGIRQADIFLANIDRVRDMDEVEIKDWKAQTKFMKAYYLFLLVQKYGPIVIPEAMVTADSTNEELFLPRKKVEFCFDYILKLIEEAIPDLSVKAKEINAGQVDQLVARSIKARILLFRASPFFNGNMEYFGDFNDHDGQPFFPLEYKKEKWDDALKAVNAAIDSCKMFGISIYEYSKDPYPYDREDAIANPDKMKTLYDLRMVICDPWNKELIWGLSNIDYYSEGAIGHAANMRLPEGYGGGVVNTPQFSWQWLGTTYQVAERYYTENGLPIDQDLTYQYDKIHEIVKTPGAAEAEYTELRGYMQPGMETINLYLNREPRFYANLGITGGYWRGHSVRINSQFFMNTEGGYNSSQHTTDFYATGIAFQKFVHPENMSGAWQRVVNFPYPLIRLADLYLMKAEILNEIKNAPDQEVWDAINVIRKRAGIPNVEAVWSDATLAKTVNYHKTKEGMRDIILRERSIELSFEGSRYWDMVRYKKAVSEFSAPIRGWNHTGTNAATFFVLQVKEARKFTITDCLWPIWLAETNTNGNLIQNPGW
ncbi:MAG: RagB/SusD family nutrient uptake outer membrane protein [Dysgonomonas sp.]